MTPAELKCVATVMNETVTDITYDFSLFLAKAQNSEFITKKYFLVVWLWENARTLK
jgi:hypothetical protein